MAQYSSGSPGKRTPIDVEVLFDSDQVSAWSQRMLRERQECIRVAGVAGDDVLAEVEEFYKTQRLFGMPVVPGTEWILDTGTGRHLCSREKGYRQDVCD